MGCCCWIRTSAPQVRVDLPSPIPSGVESITLAVQGFGAGALHCISPGRHSLAASDCTVSEDSEEMSQVIWFSVIQGFFDAFPSEKLSENIENLITSEGQVLFSQARVKASLVFSEFKKHYSAYCTFSKDPIEIQSIIKKVCLKAFREVVSISEQRFQDYWKNRVSSFYTSSNDVSIALLFPIPKKTKETACCCFSRSREESKPLVAPTEEKGDGFQYGTTENSSRGKQSVEERVKALAELLKKGVSEMGNEMGRSLWPNSAIKIAIERRASCPFAQEVDPSKTSGEKKKGHKPRFENRSRSSGDIFGLPSEGKPVPSSLSMSKE